ncbi:uncharacterized protein LOC129808526 [Phlebotomus papatasi]|uniref:uncharacterized protein LOC129808526 n=1 Tax=Phlebotomus papatasi TaxID=29031 RepID=UPI00248435B3|nr:uncharacterized protein LOC129808526 [Phlebotomus papatasi]
MRSANFLVETVGSSLQSSQHQADVVIHPWIKSSPYALPINCLVMRTITGDQPNWDVSGIHIDIPRNFHLADPDWQSRKPVDILIGGQFYWEILRDETHYLGSGLPLMKNTTFGWVVVGSCDNSTVNSNLVTCNLTTLENIEQTLRKFFTIEDVPKQSSSKEEHKQVEELYSSTTTRDADGRYIVQLPFNSNLEKLQTNRSSAMRQLHFLETKLKKDVDLWEKYSNIFEEYLEKDFIEVVPYNELERQSFYMPHHCVVKKEAVSTKVRIVFNASSPSSSGVSLNDTLMVGPCVQPTLMSTLLNFRLHAITFTCDIVKMYLQTRVHEQHRDFLRFLWRTPDNR